MFESSWKGPVAAAFLWRDPMTLEFATRMATQNHLHDFKASVGWLDKFKARHGIRAGKVVGEATQEWKPTRIGRLLLGKDDAKIKVYWLSPHGLK